MMKRFTFLMAILCLFSSQVLAQNYSLPLQEQLDFAVSALDLSQVKSGYLLDKAHSLVDIKSLNGECLDEANRTIRTTYELAFAAMQNAATFPQDGLPSFSIMQDRLDDLLSAGKTPLSLMIFNHHYFKPDALSKHLLSHDGLQFRDVPGREASPYLEGHLFAATVGETLLEGKEFEFILPSDLIFSNIEGEYTDLEINFDDGNGWQSLIVDKSYPIVFESTGIKEITLRCRLSNKTSLITQTILKTKEPEEPEIDKMFSTAPDDTVQFDHGTYYIYYNNDCNEDKIIKPFIFVEGFDPFDSTGIDQFNQLVSQDFSLPSGRIFRDEIHAGGYNMIFVNFKDGGAILEDNAEFIKELIRDINQRKAANGSSEKNVVLGVSMGGVACKWALREMELDFAEDHETQMFISIDSPFRGANIPLGFQAVIKSLAEHPIIPNLVNMGDVSFPGKGNPLKEGMEKINSPAAKNMLFYHLGSTPNYSAWHDDFYSQFWALGDLDVQHIAIANGSDNGIGQLLGAGDAILDVDLNTAELLSLIFPESFSEDSINVWGILGVGSITTIAPLRWMLEASALTGNEQTIFSGRFVQLILGIPYLNLIETNVPAGLLPLDSAPGGMRPFGRIEPGQNDLGFDWGQYSFCFIPTFSAFDLNADNLSFDFSNSSLVLGTGATPVKAYLGAVESTFQWGPPNDAISPSSPLNPPQVNQEHAFYIDRRIASFLSYQTVGDSSLINLNSLDDRIYNFGSGIAQMNPGLNSAPNTSFPLRSTRHAIDNNLLVSGSSRLWLNRLGRIGFTDIATNSINEAGTEFPVAIQKGCGAETTVEVINGGKMHIGQASNTSTLSIEEGCTLWIRSAGHLTVDNGSKIIVKSGATLVLGANSELKVNQGGEVIIEEGGEMRIYEGSTVDLINDPSKIHVHGWLTIKGQFDFPGRGFFKFSKTHQLILESEFKLDGRGKGHRFIHLDFDTRLNIRGGRLNLRNGKVVYFPGSSIYAGGDSEVRFWYTDFSGSGVGLRAVNAAYVNIRSSDFTNLTEGVQLENMPNPAQSINLLLTNFNHCVRSLTAYNCHEVSVNSCNFFGGVESDFGLSAESTHSVWLNNSSFIDFSSIHPTSSKAAIYLIDVPSLHMNSGGIRNSYYGIYCPDASSEGLPASNILLTGAATIENNIYGIWIERGGLSRGSVTMNCARLINNQAVGIKGVDVLLNINGSGQTANHFEGGGTSGPYNTIGRYFEICYEQLSAPNPILGQGNYWAWNGGVQVPVNGRYAIGNFGGSLCNNFLIDDSFPIASPPQDCDGIEPPPPGDDEIGRAQHQQAPGFASDLLQIFPNPAFSDFQFKITADDYILEVLNLAGQVVWMSEDVRTTNVSVANWPRGIYLVRVTTNGGAEIHHRKLIVQ